MQGTRRLRRRLALWALVVACGVGVAGAALVGGDEARAQSDDELGAATPEEPHQGPR